MRNYTTYEWENRRNEINLEGECMHYEWLTNKYEYITQLNTQLLLQ